LISSSLNTSSGTVSSDCWIITCHFKTDFLIFREFFVCDITIVSFVCPSVHDCDFNCDKNYSIVRVCDFRIISSACEPECHPWARLYLCACDFKIDKNYSIVRVCVFFSLNYLLCMLTQMPPLGQAIWLLGSCLKGSFVLVPAWKVNLRQTARRATLASSRANLIPMQFLGP